MSSEAWKDVIGWDGLYEVSSMGRVRSIPRKAMTQFGERTYGGLPISPIKMSNGYLAVNLTNKDRRQQRTIHTLVLEAFIGIRPDGADACHNNGRRDDPRLTNLRWDTRRSNHADKAQHGTAQVGERHGNAKLSDHQVREIRSVGMSPSQVAAIFGISRSNAKKIVHGYSWKHIEMQP